MFLITTSVYYIVSTSYYHFESLYGSRHRVDDVPRAAARNVDADVDTWTTRHDSPGVVSRQLPEMHSRPGVMDAAARRAAHAGSRSHAGAGRGGAWRCRPAGSARFTVHLSVTSLPISTCSGLLGSGNSFFFILACDLVSTPTVHAYTGLLTNSEILKEGVDFFFPLLFLIFFSPE